MHILIHGIGGRMGQVVLSLCQCHYKNAEAVCGIDAMRQPEGLSFPIYREFSTVTEDLPTDTVIVDFSHHSLSSSLLSFAVERGYPVVLATTGHTEEEKCEIAEKSLSIPIFYSANMSLGVALLCSLAKTAAKTLPGADIEIVEAHHNRKLDAPSGTALMIAEEIRSVKDRAYCRLGRNGHGKREENEIGIHALRLGNVIGEHEVILATDSETVRLKHEAHTRSLFAEGALTAACFLLSKDAGLYDMHDMIGKDE